MVAACTGVGVLKSYNLAARVSVLNCFLMMVEEIKQKIRYSCIDTETLLAYYANCEQFAQLWFLPNLLTVCQKGGWNLKKIKQAISTRPFTKPEDIETFALFSEGLGKSDIQGQIAHCDLYISVVSSALENARSESREKGRLFCLLGLFSGLAVALLLV